VPKDIFIVFPVYKIGRTLNGKAIRLQAFWQRFKCFFATMCVTSAVSSSGCSVDNYNNQLNKQCVLWRFLSICSHSARSLVHNGSIFAKCACASLRLALMRASATLIISLICLIVSSIFEVGPPNLSFDPIIWSIWSNPFHFSHHNIRCRVVRGSKLTVSISYDRIY
jgi:hypothetical protein